MIVFKGFVERIRSLFSLAFDTLTVAGSLNNG